MTPPRAERLERVAPGIFKVYRRGTFVGYRALVWVVDRTSAKGGRVAPKRFPKDTRIATMKDWRQNERLVARATPTPTAPEPPAGFAGLALTYLQTVKAMPSIADRRHHIGLWVEVFRDGPLEDVTPARIRAQRDAWLLHGPRRVLRKALGRWRWTAIDAPLAPGTVNRRLRALENLFTVMRPDLPNPVRAVPECEEPEPTARGTTFDVIQEILAHMPDRTRGRKGVKGSRDEDSKTKARIAVMMYTGLAPSQLMKLDEQLHVDYRTMTYLRPRRLKGRRGKRGRSRTGTVDRARPLLPQAAKALKHLFAIGAGGTFSTSSVHKSFKRGIAAANADRLEAHRKARRRRKPELIPTTLRPYDVKHTFGAEAYRASKDLRAVQELLGLSSIELADRYARAAVAPAAAVAAAELALAAGGKGRG